MIKKNTRRLAAPKDDLLLKIARESLHAHFENREPKTSHWTLQFKDNRKGVFVSLFDKDLKLRGSAGHLEPLFSNLADETADCTIAAATKDERFAPIQKSELADLIIEVKTLEERRSTSELAALDPKQFGIIVSSGWKRGVLFPLQEGIETAEQQLHEALDRAGISPQENYLVETFSIKMIRDR